MESISRRQLVSPGKKPSTKKDSRKAAGQVSTFAPHLLPRLLSLKILRKRPDVQSMLAISAWTSGHGATHVYLHRQPPSLLLLLEILEKYWLFSLSPQPQLGQYQIRPSWALMYAVHRFWAGLVGGAAIDVLPASSS